MSTRRLLYVACTRAQSLLYILYSRQRQVAGKTKSAYLSDFVAAVFEKDHVCVIISFSGLESFDSSSRVSSVLTSLDIRPRIELSYRKSCIDQFRMKKKLNADFLNCKPARFLWVQFHNQNRRKSAGDKVKPVYRQANGEFYTVSLTGEKSVQDSPRKWSHLHYIKASLLSSQPALQSTLTSMLSLRSLWVSWRTTQRLLLENLVKLSLP